MTHHSRLRLRNFPLVDEKVMLNLNSAASFMKEPSASFQINLNQEILPNIGPIIDVSEKSFKINFAPIEEVRSFYAPLNTDFLKSFLIHAGLVFIFIILNIISIFSHTEPQIVEITFGLTDKITKTQQEKDKRQLDGETEATKTVQDLPQLPKNASPDVAPKPALENDLSNSKKEDSLVLSEKKKIEPPAKSEKQEEKPKPVGTKIETTQKNIDEKDYLKRKEEDLRKVAEEKKQGVHGKTETKPEGQKKPSLTVPPKSPFQTPDAIPDAPTGLAPAGDEKGVNITNYNTYRLYLKKQLQLNWNLNEGSDYPKNLKTIVEFTLNPFGYLLGKPKIHQSSGNKNFDDLALKAVEVTFPVGTPPPKSIHPPQTFKATYSAKDID